MTLAKRLRSGPISDSTVSTEVAAKPLMRVRSTPAQRASAVRKGNGVGEAGMSRNGVRSSLVASPSPHSLPRNPPRGGFFFCERLEHRG